MGGGPHKAALFSIDAHIIDMNHVIKKKKKKVGKGAMELGTDWRDGHAAQVKILGCRCVLCYPGVIASKPFSWQSKENLCAYQLVISSSINNPYVIICICIKLNVNSYQSQTLIHNHMDYSSSLLLLICKLSLQQWEIWLPPSAIGLLNSLFPVSINTSTKITNPVPPWKRSWSTGV